MQLDAKYAAKHGQRAVADVADAVAEVAFDSFAATTSENQLVDVVAAAGGDRDGALLTLKALMDRGVKFANLQQLVLCLQSFFHLVIVVLLS